MASYLSVDKTDVTEVVKVLSDISTAPTGENELDIALKDEALKSLLDDLCNAELQSKWNDQTRFAAIRAVKTLGREPIGADVLFSEKGVSALLELSAILKPKFSDNSVNSEALRCLANSIYLVGATKTIFWQLGGVSGGVAILKNENVSLGAQFLIWRILFLMTVDRLDVVKLLIEELDIGDLIGLTLERQVGTMKSNPVIEDLADNINTPAKVISETLKTLYNIMLNGIKLQSHGLPVSGADEVEPEIDINDEQRLGLVAKNFERCLPPILALLLDIPSEDNNILAPPYSHAIHALLNYPVTIYSTQFSPPGRPTALLTKLVATLDKTLALNDTMPDDMPQQFTESIEASLPPLCVLLTQLAKGSDNTRILLKNFLLPDDVDRTKPLQKGSSLNARLIRCMTSAMMPHVKDSVSELLFTVCNEDAEILIQHTGLGNAAGFLTAHNILVTPGIINQANEKISEQNINPITGQYWEEPVLDLSTMTDEEKEREAERLFVLFERLNKTGVVTAENPIAKAMREMGSE